MLVQTPSKILKSDYRFWDLAPSAAIADVYKNERKVGGTDHTLYEVLEFVIYRDSQNLVTLKADQKAIFLPLYGKIRINNFQKVIEAGEAVIFEASEDQDVFIKNILTDEDADVLVIKFNKKITENSYRINHLDLEIRNKLNFIDTGFSFPGFIGIFDGREVGRYILKERNNGIFGMVINGAFEFQNRLLENRDAVLIWDIEELEFEALSENAIILFFEIPE
ncbi:pirin family protein [Epilithonimonas lactis]|uniref:Quercetin 2,3-dioxygenase C-terminal cupin domain-containing protein n=1 Tax=Epilithonimonas lactis TaxID=421072 RepID=A0A085BFE0_9FLAO|nr:hypothetical protein [Epilithonimonas lactis]KFC21185.1 hypothetical protein IO89_13335 [Epilithonimonas lactis]SEP76249.1 hypothetical protein SAMN04488097_0566 [Epilithonimonas lactis]